MDNMLNKIESIMERIKIKPIHGKLGRSKQQRNFLPTPNDH